MRENGKKSIRNEEESAKRTNIARYAMNDYHWWKYRKREDYEEKRRIV